MIFERTMIHSFIPRIHRILSTSGALMTPVVQEGPPGGALFFIRGWKYREERHKSVSLLFSLYRLLNCAGLKATLYTCIDE